MSHRTKQLGWLLAPVGGAGSGAARYGAAMYFYGKGEMPAGMLEIYRRCAKFDREDPVDLALYEGVPLPALVNERTA